VSLYHWVATALLHGRAGIAEGQQSFIADEQVARMRDLIEAEGDAGLGPESAVLTVITQDGREWTTSIERCKGSIANPMTDDDLSEKFRGQATLQLTPESASHLLKQCWRVDELADVAEIARLSRPG
jgi:2-methylcitrate dehydratase PrpD